MKTRTSPGLSASCAEMVDADLVALAQKGNEDAVRMIVGRHNRQLFRAARAIMRNDDEAEDVVQEAYVRAFSKLDGFRAQASLSTWLTRIVLNEAFGRLRRRRTEEKFVKLNGGGQSSENHIIPFPFQPRTHSPENHMARQQIRGMLEHMIDDLPDSFRAVFVLRDIEGLSTDEAARCLDIKPQTVKTRLYRARRMLKAAFEESFTSYFSDLFPFDGARCTNMADRVVRQLKAR